MTQKQNDPQNNKQEEAVKDQRETFQETDEQKNASAPLEADCQSEAKPQDETSQQGKTSQQGFSAEQKEESSSCSPCDSNEKQRAEIGDAVRDEALSAAEKGLEAARAALEAAERKLAEAQQAAYGYSTVAQSSSQDVQAAQEASQSPSDAQQPFAAGEYAPPQGIPQQPATQPFANAANSGEGFSGQTAQGQFAQSAGQQIPVGQQDSYQAPYQQAGEYSYQQPGAAPYQQDSYQEAQNQQASYQQAQQTQDQQIPNQQSQSQQAPYQQPGYSQTQQSASQHSQQPPVQPHYAPPVASRDHVAAGLLAIFLGFLGIHKFYLGYNTQGFIMLSIALIGGLLSFGLVMGVVWIIGVVEGIVYLTKSQSEFERLYIYNKREWF